MENEEPWRPIETYPAPLGFGPIAELLMPDGDIVLGGGFDHGGGNWEWIDPFEDELLRQPTHWRPRPAGPLPP